MDTPAGLPSRHQAAAVRAGEDGLSALSRCILCIELELSPVPKPLVVTPESACRTLPPLGLREQPGPWTGASRCHRAPPPAGFSAPRAGSVHTQPPSPGSRLPSPSPSSLAVLCVFTPWKPASLFPRCCPSGGGGGGGGITGANGTFFFTFFPLVVFLAFSCDATFFTGVFFLVFWCVAAFFTGLFFLAFSCIAAILTGVFFLAGVLAFLGAFGFCGVVLAFFLH